MVAAQLLLSYGGTTARRNGHPVTDPFPEASLLGPWGPRATCLSDLSYSLFYVAGRRRAMRPVAAGHDDEVHVVVLASVNGAPR